MHEIPSLEEGFVFVCVCERESYCEKESKVHHSPGNWKHQGVFTQEGERRLWFLQVLTVQGHLIQKPPSQWLLEQHPMQRRLQKNCKSFSLMAARWEILIWCNSVIDHLVCCYCNCDLEKKGNGSSVVRSKISVYCLNYRQKWDAVVTLKLSNGCYLNCGAVETHPTVNPK